MPERREPIEVVTFDFWDTICVAPPLDATRVGRVVRLRETLAEAGATVLEAQLDAALADVRRSFDEHWKANRQYTHRDAVATLLEVLDVELEGAHLQRFTGSFTGETSEFVPELAPNVAATIRLLKASGVRVGIICDVGLAPSIVLRRHLEHHGILELFDHFSFSDEVGWYKPAPEIFEHALAGLASEPERAAHVGDLCRTDIAGALGMGMTAVRYTGAHDDSTSADQTPPHAVIDDHADLPGLLGL